MGFHDALYKLDINFDSEDAVIFSDESMEVISYNAILASTDLARERGAYSTFAGSKWDRGLLPQDTLKLLEEARHDVIDVTKTGKLDWTPVRQAIKQFGMRNSNCMAIAPTATISNIVGTIPCIEPIYKNIYVKANMNGDFIVINPYLVQDLKNRGLWDYEILGQLKYHDGSVKNIAAIPQDVKDKYKEVFEIDPKWLIRTAAFRGKWIDQSQSLNIYYAGTSGRELANIYEYAWKMGLKTTYYLRSLGASQVEKSTVSTAEFGSTHKRGGTPTTDVKGIEQSPAPSMTPSPISILTPVQEIKVETQSPIANVQPVVNQAPAFTAMREANPVPATQKPAYNITRAPEATCDGCQ
jgi:ribonucleoside-diphosphate reductase alpha chain